MAFNPMNQLKNKQLKDPHILTWMVDFRPWKLTMRVVFDIESESEVKSLIPSSNPTFYRKRSLHEKVGSLDS